MVNGNRVFENENNGTHGYHNLPPQGAAEPDIPPVFQQAKSTLEQFVRHQPAIAVAVGISLGVLVGCLIKRK